MRYKLQEKSWTNIVDVNKPGDLLASEEHIRRQQLAVDMGSDTAAILGIVLAQCHRATKIVAFCSARTNEPKSCAGL